MDFDRELLMKAQRVLMVGTAQRAASLAQEVAEKRERQIQTLRAFAQIEVDLGAQYVGGRNDGTQRGR